MSNNNGGPAFPCLENGQGFATGMSGMSLRDYFAASWLQGWIANPNTGDMERELCAAYAYAMADAMLKERAK